jgi:hypothetical protein
MSAILRISWLNPDTYPPPSGVNILLKTRYGRAIIGNWEDGGAYIAWQYLPE